MILAGIRADRSAEHDGKTVSAGATARVYTWHEESQLRLMAESPLNLSHVRSLLFLSLLSRLAVSVPFLLLPLDVYEKGAAQVRDDQLHDRASHGSESHGARGDRVK